MTTPVEMPVDYARVLKVIKETQPRALTPDQYSDVASIIEWMQQELIAQEAKLVERRNAVAAREEAVTKREREVAIRSRVLHVAAGIPTPRKGLLRYLKG